LVANVLIDDGAAVYLNGQELVRVGLNPGATGTDWAARTVGDATVETFSVPAGALVVGSNLLAAELHQVNATSSDITFGLELVADVVTRTRDLTPPVVTHTVPVTNSAVRSFTRLEVHFSEPVTGVDASDLLVNGVPATGLVFYGPDIYTFLFDQPATGIVHVTWAPNHGIRDLSVNANLFEGGDLYYVLDPNINLAVVRINEFMASNRRGIRDEDGDTSDWIELYNFGTVAISMAGWYLTDDPRDLSKWAFPAVTIPANGYLVVWASGKNRRDPARPLHANFALSQGGEFLALVLVSPGGETIVASSFAPAYPPQYDDVSYGCDRLDPSILGYFTTPTPGAPNSTTGAGFGPEVAFSRDSGTFTSPFELTLRLVPASTNYYIGYLLVTNSSLAQQTNLPASTFIRYTGPIRIDRTVQVRARAFPIQTNVGLLPGPLKSESYVWLSAAAAQFSSDLPIVLIHNFGGGGPPAEYTGVGYAGVLMAFDTNTPSGRASMTNPPSVVARAGFHLRGSSTQGYPKKSLTLETWSEVNFEDKDIELLGMPAESDWAFYAPNFFDQVLIKNPFAHEVSRELVGRYSPRTRFVEMFLDVDGGAVSYNPTNTGPGMGDYYGVNVVLEKIKRNRNRVDVTPITYNDTNHPAISGGYLLKIDRVNDPDDVNNFSSPTGYTLQSPIIFVDPDGLQVRIPQQRNWVIEYIRSFENALRSPDFTNPVTGYAAWMDPDDWIDRHIVEAVTFNIDAYRLSGYFYKDRTNGLSNGRLRQGPHWDYDRTQGCGGPPNNDNRAYSPRQWRRQLSGDQGTDLFGNPSLLGVQWWQRLFNDIDFWQKWIDRWQELRRTTLTSNALWAITDSMGAALREAQVREVRRWGGNGASDTRPRNGTITDSGYSYTFNGTYQAELEFHKKWMADRLHFIDTNFLSPPVFSRGGGPISPGTPLTITTGTVLTNSVIYYTLDGTDPRLPGGGVSPTALVATNQTTVILTNNARVFARNWNPNHRNLTNYPGAVGGNPPLTTPWSGPTIATFVVSTPPIRITEIMYRPYLPPGDTNDASNFEYVELTNVGETTVSLIGYRFTNGIRFTFTASSPITQLAPGQRCLIVGNRASFVARFPDLASLVAGEFEGNLDNAGERLAFIGPLWEPILDFRYDPDWDRLTDGYGFSLVVVDPNAPPWAWTNATQWRASTYDGGSPGAADPAPVSVLPVVINEVLTHSVAPAVDAVELFNPNPTPVDISHWYLTDNRDVPRKYRIPAGTIIPANGYLVLYETNSFNQGGTNFAFSRLGEEVYVFSGDAAGRLTGYFQGFDFGAAAALVTFGRYTNSVGRVMEVAQSYPTLGGPNAPPMVGPVVINEIMFYPPDLYVDGQPVSNARDEFIELRNITDMPVPLYDPNYPSNTWQLTAGVQYRFPPGVVLPPGGHLLVVSFTPELDLDLAAAFRSRYGLSEQVPLYGPWSGRLGNEGERVELRRPDTPDAATGFVPMVLVDRVDYETNAPWATLAASGTGASLQRVVAAAFGNDPTNWIAAGPSAGRDRALGTPPSIVTPPVSTTVVEEGQTSFRVEVAGTPPFLYQWYFEGKPIDGAYSSVLVLTNVQLHQAGWYRVYVLSENGSVFSDPVRLTVLPIPVITQQPVSTNVQAGSNFTLRVVATGTGPLSYQWQFQPIGQIGFENILGATEATFAVTNAQLIHSGLYRVLVTDSIGTRASAAAEVNVLEKPAIVLQPQSLTVPVGGTVSLSVQATGSQPLWYRWRKNASTLVWPGESTLTLPNVGLDAAGTYDVVITNIANTVLGGFARSSNAYVIVVAPPPASLTVAEGTNVTLSAVVSLPRTFASPFGWLFNGQPIGNGTNTSTSTVTIFTNNLVLTNFSRAQAGTYTLLLTNSLGAPAAFTTQVRLSGTEQPIPLSIRLEGTEAVVSWEDAGGGWLLEEATDLTPPGNWQPSSAVPVREGDRWSVRVPVTDPPQKFFRLKLP